MQVGQPILGAGNELQLDAHGNVVKYTAAQTTQPVSETYYWIPTSNSMTIHLTEHRRRSSPAPSRSWSGRRR